MYNSDFANEILEKEENVDLQLFEKLLPKGC